MTTRHGPWAARLRALACGGILFGWVQAFGGLNFASILTQFLAELFSAILALLLGDTSTL